MAVVLAGLAALTLAAAGCGDTTAETGTHATRTNSRTVGTGTSSTTAGAVAGIVLDPALQSATGTPSAEEMPALIDLQKKVPYPVIVPTKLPGGCKLDAGLISSGNISGDPSGYYSFRYSDPGNESRTLTFNQSRANSKPLSGYYLTESDINGTTYHVYWHRTREYLPNGDPVRTTQVVNAETYVVTWQGQYTDSAGAPHDVYYSLTVGTWSGWDWGDIRNILEGLKPLSQVAG